MTDLRESPDDARPESAAAIDTVPPEPVAVEPAPTRWRAFLDWWTPGRAGLAVYIVVLAVYIRNDGIPLDRIGQTGWLLGGIIVHKIGRPLWESVRAVLDWIPLLAALVAYDHTRGVADTLGMPVHITDLVAAERALFGGELPTVVLQNGLYDVDAVHWWDLVASIVYFTHFVVPWVLAAIFYLVSRALWVRYIRRVLLLTFAGLATYVLFPAAPPWYAAYYDYIPEDVARIATRGWELLHLRTASAWLSNAQADANPIAAMPSLHTAFALLVVVALWPHVRSWAARGLLVAFPLAMTFTLVYGGEHYIVDVLAGWAYVALVCMAAGAWERWRASRSAPHALLDQPS